MFPSVDIRQTSGPQDGVQAATSAGCWFGVRIVLLYMDISPSTSPGDPTVAVRPQEDSKEANSIARRQWSEPVPLEDASNPQNPRNNLIVSFLSDSRAAQDGSSPRWLPWASQNTRTSHFLAAEGAGRAKNRLFVLLSDDSPLSPHRRPPPTTPSPPQPTTPQSMYLDIQRCKLLHDQAYRSSPSDFDASISIRPYSRNVQQHKSHSHTQRKQPIADPTHTSLPKHISQMHRHPARCSPVDSLVVAATECCPPGSYTTRRATTTPRALALTLYERRRLLSIKVIALTSCLYCLWNSTLFSRGREEAKTMW
ncbi:hypothetical protein K474DRAFT_1207590 [Panus rudis PR-1116 ss-1]|nr:hypothetical protein K474DRAFT_1207590 [Panus rudis PR-1116 ss-1]